MRLFQIDQVIFDLDKLTQSEYFEADQQLVLLFNNGMPLVLNGEYAETVWILLSSLACDLSFKKDVPISAQGKALDECPL